MKYTQVTASLIVASAALSSANKVNARNVVDSNVQIKKATTSSESTTTAEFADAPLSTAVTTDANGSTVTSYVWWEASTTSATESQASTSAKSSAKSSAESSATGTSSESSTVSVTTAEFADAPLSTAVTTNADGVTVTSYVWWEASTTSSATSSATSTGTSSEASSTGSSETTTGSTTTNWDEPLYTTTETLSNGEVTTQEIWWTPSVTSDTLAASTASASSTEVSTSSETYTSNGSTFTTQTLVTLASKKNTNSTASSSSTHYTVVNGTTEAVNGAVNYQDSMYVALGAAVIGLLV